MRLGLVVFALGLIILSPAQVFSFTKPKPPIAPQAPEAPSPPEVSGGYGVPERPGLRVRVFAHPPKPTPPQVPGRTPTPATPDPTPAATATTSLACNLADSDANSVVGKAGWKIPNGGWTYQLNLNSTPSAVGQGNLDSIVKAGFDQYALASGYKINFTRGANTSVNRARLDNRNIITWARASSGTLGVTYVWYYPSTGLAVEIDTIMNNRYKWTWSNSNACADILTYDAQNIMTHELGHWLGLADEYNNSLFADHTMYGYGSVKEVKKNTLTSGDKSGIISIYSP